MWFIDYATISFLETTCSNSHVRRTCLETTCSNSISKSPTIYDYQTLFRSSDVETQT